MIGRIVKSPLQSSSQAIAENRKKKLAEQRLQQQNQQQEQQVHNNHNNFIVRDLEEIQTEISERLLAVTGKHPNSKISKALYDLQENITQKKIVTVLTEIAEKPEICIDFNVPLSELLDMYAACREDPVLSEAGYMIFSSSQIYSRRVDNIFESFSQIIAGIDEDLNVMQEKANDDVNNPEKSRKAPKRLLQPNDHLYEAEVIPKKFKIAADDKITEKVTDLCLLDPPKHFFKNWREYKEWRLQQKKRMKGHVPYSIVCDDQYVHPSMWKNSCIQDFDYEDDVDTKRSFRIFTNYIEHRYNTLVNDVNFVIHFKVKDYIEAEEDRIEEMNNLGLPSPPKRRWPPFCGGDVLSSEYVRENFNIDLCNDNEKDYLKNYVELENAVLEQENWFEKDRSKAKRKIDFSKSKDFIGNLDNYDSDIELLPLNDDISLVEKPVQNILNTSQVNVTNNSENLNNTNVNEINQHNNNTQNDIQLYDKNNENSNSKNSLSQTTKEDQQPQSKENSSITSQENSDSTNAISSTKTQEIDKNNIIVRLSLDVDEGVCFGDLDEIDRAMLLPVVELVDILKPISQNLLTKNDNITLKFNTSNNSFYNDSQIFAQNTFGIHESYLSYHEDFQLPVEYFQFKLNLNILRLPESKLRRRKIFELPPEYDLMKKDRFKRNYREMIQRKYRVFKLNDCDMTGIPLTPPSSPRREQEFLGFTNDEIDCPDLSFDYITSYINRADNSKSTNNCLLSADGTHSRTNSRDSGVGLPITEIENIEVMKAGTQQVIEKKNENSSIPEDSGLTDLNSTSIAESTLVGDDVMIDSLLLQDSGIQSTNSSVMQNTNNSSSSVQMNNLENNICTNLQNELEENNIISEKIQKWHRHLKPLLANVKERHHFDIFGLGTEIIETFTQKQKQQGNAVITLEDVMEGKDPSFISRYFLSTLLLTNQRNIDITVHNQNDQVPTSFNNIYLKLLSTKRHTVSNEDNVGMHNSVSRKRPHSPVPSTSAASSNSNRLNSNLNDFICSTPSVSSHSNQQGDFFINENSIKNSKTKVITESRISNDDSDTDDDDDDNQNLSILSKRYKLQVSNNSNNSNTTLSSVLTATTSILQTNLINETINYTDNDGFMYPKKTKNFLSLTNKSFDNNDDTDSGFHSQISSSSQKSIVF